PLGEGAGVELLMQDAAAGRHPLHVARPDATARSSGITMLHLALVDDGHGLEAAVRMLAHTTRPRGRIEMRGRRVIEQQEGTQLPAEPVIAEQRTHGETIAHPVRTGRAMHTKDLLHLRL